MQASLDFAGFLILAILSGGTNSTDVAALIPPAHYFESRQIDTTVDRMIDVVIAEPKSPKDQIMQLAALRQLADDADNFKKAKNYATNRMAIEEIAQGKRGADPQGFAQEYARKVLAQLDGKKTDPAPVRALREHALNWFPADVTFAAALDLRQSSPATGDPVKELLKLLPREAKLQMYDLAEKLGNIRVERIAFGMVGGAKNEDQKIFLRITGKGNPAWIIDQLQTATRGKSQISQMKAADGTPIQILQQVNREPIIMLIGDTDMMVVGHARPNPRDEALMTEVLEARDRKKPHAAAGPLKDLLAKIPDKASALMVGEIPEWLKRELNQEFGKKFEPAPAKMSASIERTPLGLDVKFESEQANAEEAAKLQQTAVALLKEGIEGVKKANKELPAGAPPVPFLDIINLLGTVQVQSNAERLQMRVLVPNNLIQQFGRVMMSELR
jgi:hypothetical protein